MPPEDPRAEDHQRHRDEGEEGELGVDPDEHRPHPHQLHDLEEKAPGDLVHEAVEDLAVVGDPADHRPNLMPVVVGDGEILELVDHLLAERAGEPGADRVGEPPLQYADDREEDPGERQRQHDHEQRGLEVGKRVGPRLLQRPSGKDVVDHVLLKLRRHELRDDPQERQQAEDDRPAGMRPEDLADAGEDPPLLHAARAGLLARRLPQAAGVAARRIERGGQLVVGRRRRPGRGRLGGLGRDSLAGRRRRRRQRPAAASKRAGELDLAVGRARAFTRLLQRPRDLVEARRQGIGIAEKVDPFAVGLDLEHSPANAGAGAHLGNVRPGDDPQDLPPHAVGRRGRDRPGAIGRKTLLPRRRQPFPDDGEMVGGDEKPFPPRFPVERHVGVDRDDDGAVIQPGGVERCAGRRGKRASHDTGRGGGWRGCGHRRMLPGPFD